MKTFLSIQANFSPRILIPWQFWHFNVLFTIGNKTTIEIYSSLQNGISIPCTVLVVMFWDSATHFHSFVSYIQLISAGVFLLHIKYMLLSFYLNIGIYTYI